MRQTRGEDSTNIPNEANNAETAATTTDQAINPQPKKATSKKAVFKPCNSTAAKGPREGLPSPREQPSFSAPLAAVCLMLLQRFEVTWSQLLRLCSQFLSRLSRLQRIESWPTVERSSAPVESSGGTKTILAVDDDPVILKLVCEALRDGGYDMLTSENGPAAVELSRTHMGVIHLLLSDFQMPEMSGIQLATEMTTSRPNLKVLLMSGFTEGMLVLNEGWHFLAKPFIPSQLRALVTGLLYPDKSRFRK